MKKLKTINCHVGHTCLAASFLQVVLDGGWSWVKGVAAPAVKSSMTWKKEEILPQSRIPILLQSTYHITVFDLFTL